MIYFKDQKIAKSISVEWYDGPMKGFAECPVTYENFHFEFIGWGHPKLFEEPDYPVFYFSRSMLYTFEDIESVFRKYDKPDYPFWLPQNWNEEIQQNVDKWDRELREDRLIVCWKLPESDVLKIEHVKYWRERKDKNFSDWTKGIVW
ncbi:hypothetical protein [Halocola ammonii]